MDLRGRRAAAEDAPRRRAASRSAVTRRWSRASRQRSPRRSALGRRGLLDLQAEARHRRRRRPGAGGARSGRPGGPDPGRRQRGLGCRDGQRTLGELEELDIELAEQPVATLEEAAEVAAATSIPIAGDESIESRADAERASRSGLRPDRGEALQGRRAGGGDRDRRGAAAYISSALDGPVGIAAAAQVAQTLARRSGRGASTSPTASRPSASSPRPWPRSSASCASGMLHLPPGPGLGVEIDESGAGRPSALACLETYPIWTVTRPGPVDPTNANTALASAFVEELARGGLRHAVVSPGSRSTPLAVALWRQAEIEVTVSSTSARRPSSRLGRRRRAALRWRCSAPRAPRSPTTTRP